MPRTATSNGQPDDASKSVSPPVGWVQSAQAAADCAGADLTGAKLIGTDLSPPQRMSSLSRVQRLESPWALTSAASMEG